ncbi:MAG: hypothetical protein IKE43_12095 [Coriobacteriales bacterium]|nr:hypothetical protein [Coriobacteriales bacterium]
MKENTINGSIERFHKFIASAGAVLLVGVLVVVAVNVFGTKEEPAIPLQVTDEAIVEELATEDTIMQEPVIIDEPVYLAEEEVEEEEIDYGLSYTQYVLLDTIPYIPSPGPSLCAQWVCDVFNAMGIETPLLGCARDYYFMFCNSQDFSDLEVGMIVAGVGNNIYGHIGIYVGDGTVVSSETWGGEGTIVYTSIWEFMVQYGSMYEVMWGWMSDLDLSLM